MSQLHLILESVRVERAVTAAEAGDPQPSRTRELRGTPAHQGAARMGLGFDRLDRPLRAEVIIRPLPSSHMNGNALPAMAMVLDLLDVELATTRLDADFCHDPVDSELF